MAGRAGADTRLGTTVPGNVTRSSSPVLQALFFGLAYFAAAQLRDWLSLGPSHLPTFWLPAGLFVGVLLRVAPRRWPLFVAAAAVANIVFNAAEQGHPVLVGLGVAAANALEAVTGAGLLHRFWFRGRAAGFATLGDVLAVLIIAGAAAPLVGATAGAGVIAGVLGASYSQSWAIMWSIHAVAVLLVAPIVLVLPALGQLRSLWRDTPFARRLEITAMLVAVAACSLLFFLPVPPGLPVAELVLPILIWPALRGGPLGVAAAVAVMALVATRATTLGHGPFADPDYDAASAVLLLQAFITVAAVSAHVLAAVTVERQSALARLASFNTGLEARVAARTAEIAGANAALRESEERTRRSLDELRAIYDGAPVGLCVLDRDLRYVRVNERLARFHGIPAAAHIGRTVREILPDLADAVEPVYRRILATGEPTVATEFEAELKGQPALRRVWTVSRIPLRDGSGQIIGVNVTIEDITERKATELALKESEAGYRTLIGALPQLVWTCGADGARDFVSAQWLAYTGLEEADQLGYGWLGAIHPKDREALTATWSRAVEERAVYDAEARIRGADGGYRWFKQRAVPVLGSDGAVAKWFGTSTDITDIVAAREALMRSNEDLEALVKARTRALEATQAKLVQAQKMEAVGQLTGGVAHDFNNLLTVIMGNLERLRVRLTDQPRLGRRVEAMQQAAERGERLTGQLLAFSRRQKLRPETLDLNTLIRGFEPMIRQAVGESVRVEAHLAQGLWPCTIDAAQLETSLLNLAVNARDAMPEGGRLIVETQNVERDDRLTARVADASPGPYLVLAVSDTGTGMPPEVVARAFEPFYTTKGVGKGSGLGLSQVYGFVEQSGGHVMIDSEVGQGTTVRLHLPPATNAAATLDRTRPLCDTGSARGSERVLLVEDDAYVLRTATDMMTDLGYEVRAAAGPLEALEMLRGGEPIDLLFSDVVMPNMSGIRLAEEARRLRPGLKVLLTSGYSRESLSSRTAPAGNFPVLSKPYKPSDLGAQLRAVLDAR
ncbi:MAG TPA: PAS domain-containing protein [Stellaceae bacterium]